MGSKNYYTYQIRDQTAVIVGNVTNDERMLELGKLKVCALKFSETARARIVKAGG